MMYARKVFATCVRDRSTLLLRHRPPRARINRSRDMTQRSVSIRGTQHAMFCNKPTTHLFRAPSSSCKYYPRDLLSIEINRTINRSFSTSYLPWPMSSSMTRRIKKKKKFSLFFNFFSRTFRNIGYYTHKRNKYVPLPRAQVNNSPPPPAYYF